MASDRFYAKAATLGHDKALLDAGQTVTSTISVSDVGHLRAVCDDGASVGTRHARAALIKEQYPAAFAPDAAGTPNGVLKRLEAHVVGDEPLAPNDASQIAHLFPMSFTATSAEILAVPEGGVIDLGTSGPPVILNCGEVRYGRVGKIVIRNTPLMLIADTFAMHSDDDGGPRDFSILGAPGATGAAGHPGATGTPPGDGEPGGTGGTGEQGGTGGDGLPSLLSYITVTTDITSGFYIFTSTGAGGNGGAGGEGGRGSGGGRGQIWANPAGGPGGKGGQGGTGGAGGNGSVGEPIFVTVPTGQSWRVVKQYDIAPPPGGGGAGGAGGPGGPGGPAAKSGTPAADGPAGSPGSSGAAGSRGGALGPINVIEAHD